MPSCSRKVNLVHQEFLKTKSKVEQVAQSHYLEKAGAQTAEQAPLAVAADNNFDMQANDEELEKQRQEVEMERAARRKTEQEVNFLAVSVSQLQGTVKSLKSDMQGQINMALQGSSASVSFGARNGGRSCMGGGADPQQVAVVEDMM